MSNIPVPTVGARALDFSLSASNGNLISLAGYNGRSNVYLFFVREFS